MGCELPNAVMGTKTHECKSLIPPSIATRLVRRLVIYITSSVAILG